MSMSTVKETIKKVINEHFSSLDGYYFSTAKRVCDKVDTLFDKLDECNRVTLYKRICALRNWINHFLLWFIVYLLVVLLFSSCFVSGRTIHVVTPKVDVSADTATAYTWPYNSKFQ